MLSPGTKVGSYEIVATLGVGGVGEVYRARDTKLNRDVALKVLPEAFARDAERMARFRREAQVLASLNHPNIATIYGLEESDGACALVMELVEGPTLADTICVAQGSPPSPAAFRVEEPQRRKADAGLQIDESLHIAKQIAEGLEYAHERGVIHRDLKPANVKVRPDSMVKILDFGLAKALEETPAAGSINDSPTISAAATREGMILGTAAYMSPEQARGKVVDRRCDIWSFGAVLFEMLSGKQAFCGEDVSHTLAAVIMKEPDWKAVPATTPPSIQRLVRRCLNKDPKQRLRDIGEARIAIEEELTGSPEVGAVREPPLQLVWSRALPWTLSAVLALALAVALWAPWRRSAVQPTPPPVRLDLDLGPDVSLASAPGPAVILSPDGTRLVFVSQGQDGLRRLFTRRLDQPKAAQLSGTEGAYAPFFSPDGQWVGFFAQGKLKKTRIDGGEPISLCDAPAGRGASWGEDGNIIAALDTLVGLSQVPSAGGKAVSVTSLSPEEKTHRWPQVLPGGKAVLFNASRTYGSHDDGVAVVSLKDRQTKILIEHAGMFPRYLPSGYLVYVTKGTVVAVPFDAERLEVRGTATLLEEVSSNANLGSAQLDFSRTGTLAYRTGGPEGLCTIQWLDSAGTTEAIEAEAATYNDPRLSPAGLRLAYAMNQGWTSELWIYDLQRGGKIRLTPGSESAWPVWSPDGRFVVFQAVGGIFWKRADGAGNPEPLTQSKNILVPNSFTPDGTRLVFSEVTPDGRAEIRILPVESRPGQLRAGEPQFFLKTSTVQTFAAFSPDGRWLAYADAGAGSYDVYVRAFPDKGTQVLISNAGGVMPVWSRNGHELFYRTEDQRIMVVNYTVKGESFVADKPRVWSGKQLANIGLSVNFDLAPDGKRFAGLTPAESPEPREAQSHVTLLVNFLDEVRRRVTPQGK